MTSTPPNRIAALRKQAGVTQQELADLVGAHWITISKLERGKMQLTQHWMERLATALGVNFHDLLKQENDGYDIAIMGELVHGGKTTGSTWDKHVRLETHTAHDFNANWIQVLGDAGWPLLQDGDLIKFIVVENDRAIDCLGRLVFLQYSDLKEDHIVGFIDRGSQDGQFDVRPFNGPPLRNLTVCMIWVAMELHFKTFWQLPAQT